MPEAKIFGQLDTAPTRGEVLDILADFYRGHGFGALCFVVPMVTRSDQFKLYERGMPEEWMARYLENNYGLIDPIPHATLKRGEVATLQDIVGHLTPNDVERAFLDELKHSGLTDGLVIPTSGLHNAAGFFGLDLVGKDDLATADRSLMHAVAQHAHFRIDRIEISEGDGRKRLSEREREVLRWIASGKSNAEIAIILGISEATIATHLKRMFDKLQVHNRVCAALAGFKLGMLR